MSAGAKICGLKTPEAVTAAVDGGAAYLGFNFFERSPRYVAPEEAGRLAAPARARGVKIVAITVDPTDAELDRITAGLRPDLIQLHGKESPERTAGVARRTGLEVIKVISVAVAADIDKAAAYEGVADHLMFDAKTPPGAAMPGGMGSRFDWTMMKGRKFSRPWFLAGGLDPWNVAEAIGVSGAPVVDVSSGVERGAGCKDPALISAFLDAVRRA